MTKKIAVSLPDDLVAEAAEAVESGRAASVSAYVGEALRQRSGRETLAAIVADLVAEFGQPSKADQETARRVLASARSSQHRTSKPRQTDRRRAV